MGNAFAVCGEERLPISAILPFCCGPDVSGPYGVANSGAACLLHHLAPREVPRQNFPPALALPGHGLGTVLAQPDTVAVAAGGENVRNRAAEVVSEEIIYK